MPTRSPIISYLFLPIKNALLDHLTTQQRKSKLSQRQISARIGHSTHYINSISSGSLGHPPALESLLTSLVATGCSVAILITDREGKHAETFRIAPSNLIEAQQKNWSVSENPH